MARCTAPIKGHRTASARAACPACGGSRNYGYSNYGYNSSNNPSTSSYISSNRTSKVSNSKPSWSPTGSSVVYTRAEVRTLTPVRKNIEKRTTLPDPRDIFLCHAWDDRGKIAKDLYEQLVSEGVSVWFSENDVPLGSSLLREIDKGLAKSRIGIVLVTPAFLNRIRGEGIADKELSVLLSRDLLVPIVHNTTYDELRNVSPMLASKSGLSTDDDSLEIVATKLTELVNI
ncbi:MAG: toll/interleukin-1 receptor domain-containing protein [Clostridiales bacterium]|nr:toll/interleukin-1 receptor domain-containing protein [Clostridiales bacterium]